jgi:hypothetical protein
VKGVAPDGADATRLAAIRLKERLADLAHVLEPGASVLLRRGPG